MSRIETVLAILEGVNLWSAILRIVLATVIGGIIGLDRGRHGRVAGARTHILVCLGAAVTTLVGFYTAEHLGFANDPLRMGAQVISGVGFLGVGTIVIRHQSQVKGLTTAAGIWATCAIGMAVGSGMYLLAGFTTILVVILQVILHCLNVGDDAFSTHEMVVEMEDKPSLRLALDELFDCYAVTVLNSRVTKENGLLLLKLSVRMKKNVDFEEIVRFVDEHPGIRTLEM